MQLTNTILQDRIILGRKPFLFKSTMKKNVIGSGSKVIDANIARVGVFKGYRDGEFTLDRNLFDRLISNFQAEKSAAPVYRGHADLGLTPKGEEPIAAGWILALERKGDSLWAKVELTEELASEIKAGNFRYTSIFVRTENTHRETGKEIGPRLVSLAITNQPFIDGLVELSLSQRNTEKVATYSTKDIRQMIDQKENAEKILSTLALDATEERLAALETMLAEMLPLAEEEDEDKKKEEEAGKADAPEKKKEEEEDKKFAEDGAPDMERMEALRAMASELLGEELDMSGLMDKMEELISGLGEAPAEEVEEEVIEEPLTAEEMAAQANARKVDGPDAVANVAASNLALSALKVELDETKQLLEVLVEEKTSREQQDNENAVMMAIDEGKILEVTKDHWIKLMNMDRELALSLMGGQTAVNTDRIVKPSAKDAQRLSAKVIALSEHERKILAGAGIKNK